MQNTQVLPITVAQSEGKIGLNRINLEDTKNNHVSWDWSTHGWEGGLGECLKFHPVGSLKRVLLSDLICHWEDSVDIYHSIPFIEHPIKPFPYTYHSHFTAGKLEMTALATNMARSAFFISNLLVKLCKCILGYSFTFPLLGKKLLGISITKCKMSLCSVFWNLFQ